MLSHSVTFLPLKDLRYADKALQGRKWFMSSLYDTHEEGEVQYQHFPSESSKGRLLCLKGRHTHDGSWNSYALAWPNALPHNATLVNGLTFVSYNHYNYDNIWHGLSAMPEDDRRCMPIYKSSKIGFNETYFGEWTRHVLSEVRTRKIEEASRKASTYPTNFRACT
ncbi:hypothetical protein CFOL_v3_23165 [Cephalotus follicularis]|uniref:Uncharacterized protein n=1 Tax=Cephalotus follicularis TaxID=3775 RepID=A0A1Q3CHV8_CEPFO|nr:hypothetical protein CFOL_v3_23165 [Cephalotus follicularis]